MFSLKKMTVLCWDDESSISSLSLESQIFNFKDYFSSRIWNEDEFRSVFDEIDPSTGKCKGELLIGGAVIRVYGDFHVTKENRYYMESANVEYVSNPVSLNKDGSTATSSNDDTEIFKLVISSFRSSIYFSFFSFKSSLYIISSSGHTEFSNIGFL